MSFPFSIVQVSGNKELILAVGFSHDHDEICIIFGSHIGMGDNNMSNHGEPYDKGNILHCLFSLEKIPKMPKSCCVKNCNNSIKYNQNVNFYILPKDKSQASIIVECNLISIHSYG